MDNVKRLMERVLNCFDRNGIQIKNEARWITETYRSDFKVKDGEYCVNVSETYRSNATPENTTITIDIYRIEGIISDDCYSLISVFRTKVPKNASDRVIESRVKTVIETLENLKNNQ